MTSTSEVVIDTRNPVYLEFKTTKEMQMAREIFDANKRLMALAGYVSFLETLSWTLLTIIFLAMTVGIGWCIYV